MRTLFVVLLLVASTTGCSSDPVESFDFETDDLCEWVSTDDVAGFVEEAYGWEVIAVDLSPPSSDGWDCQWKLTGSDGAEGEVSAESPVWKTFTGGPYDLDQAMTQGVVDFADDEGAVPIGASVANHPSLSEGVVVHNGGFGQFAFGVPPRSQYLQVAVVIPDEDEWEQDESKFFAVADDLIEALGWLPGN